MTDCDDVVRGRVIDLSTAEAIADARVDFDTQRQQSDDEGRFQFESICKGKHTIQVERADYRRTRRTVTVDGPLELDITTEPLPVERLDDVVVVAPAAIPSQMGASTTLDGAALEQTRGRNIADSIARIPGVAVLRSGSGGQGKPIIRGQTGRRNLILYDGVRLETQKWGLEHAPEIDPFAAGSLTVIKGAGGSRYGSDAIGGVLLVDPPAMRQEPGVSGQAHLIGVSNGLRGTAALRIDGNHRRVPGLAWRAFGNFTRGQALMTPLYPLDNTGSRLWNAGGTLAYDRDRWGATFKFRHYDLRSGLCSCLRTESPEDFAESLARGVPVGSELYTRDYAIDRPYEQVRHELAIARGWVALGNAGILRLTYAFQDNRRKEFAIVRQDIEGPQFTFALDTHSTTTAFEHRALPLGHDFTLQGTTGATVSAQTNTVRANETLIPDYRQVSGGVFVIERLGHTRFEIEAAVRYDGLQRRAWLGDRHYQSQLGQQRLNPDKCTPNPDAGGRCTDAFHLASGSLGALVRPVDRRGHALELKLDLSSSARVPSVDEQFLDGGTPSFPVLGLGDARLRNERTWGGSVTAAYASRWLQTEASGYANLIQNYINFRSFPQDGPCEPLTCTVRGPVPVFGFEATNALFYGLEYAVAVTPPTWPVAFDGQLTLVRAQERQTGSYLTFVPTDRYRIAATYSWPELPWLTKGFVSIDAQFVDRQRRHDANSDFAPPPSGYVLLGASVGASVPLADQTLRVAVVGSNLTHARYREYTSLLRYFADEPGWELLLRLSLDFDIVPGQS